MKNVNSSYVGTKNPIKINEIKYNKKLKKDESRVFYQVNMVFGGNFNLTAKENSFLSKKEAFKVAKYLQKHGSEIVEKALENH